MLHGKDVCNEICKSSMTLFKCCIIRENKAIAGCPKAVSNTFQDLHLDEYRGKFLTKLWCCVGGKYNIWQSAAFPFIKEARKATKLDLFSCFSRYQAPTNSVAPSFCNPQFLDSLRRRTNSRNVSLRISLPWPINSHYQPS